MPDDDLTIHTPGDTPVAPVTAAAPAEETETSENVNTDGDSPELVALKAENAQLRATVELLNEQIVELQTAPAISAAAPASPKEVRTIGANWSSMTCAQAQAAGCSQTVLCSDGYFVP